MSVMYLICHRTDNLPKASWHNLQTEACFGLFASLTSSDNVFSIFHRLSVNKVITLTKHKNIIIIIYSFIRTSK